MRTRSIKDIERKERKNFIAQFCIVGIITLLLSIVPDIYYQVWDTVWYSIGLLLVFTSIFILNKKYNSTKWIGLSAVVLFSLMLLFLSKTAGYHAKVSLFYLPLAITIPLFISYEEKTFFYTGLLFPILLGIMAENVPLPIYRSPDMTLEKQEIYARVNFILCLFFSPFLAFKVVNLHYKQRKELEKSEQELIEKNKELAKTNQELDRFIYSLSHDLRSPIASAIGLTWLAKDENDVEQLKSFFLMQEQTLTRLDNTIQEVMNYTRNSHEKILIKQVEIRKIIDDIILYLKQNPDYNNVIFTFNNLQKVNFFSDVFRIQVILQNLITNAFQYHDKNKPTNEVKVIFDCTQEKACFEVWDNGIGIPKEYQSKIFEMFFRVHEHIKGTGLGLYIVKDAVDKLNGQIIVESKEREYTRFMVTIPNLTKI